LIVNGLGYRLARPSSLTIVISSERKVPPPCRRSVTDRARLTRVGLGREHHRGPIEVDARRVQKHPSFQDQQEPQQRLDHVRVENVRRASEQEAGVDPDRVSQIDLEVREEPPEVLPIDEAFPVGPEVDLSPRAQSADRADTDYEVNIVEGLNPEELELGQLDRGVDPDMPVDVRTGALSIAVAVAPPRWSRSARGHCG